MPQVRVKENEPFEVALRRFKRSCEKAGILTEVRRREYYEKGTAGHLIARAGTSEEVAEAAIFLLGNEFVNCTIVDVDGGAIVA